MPVGCRTKVPGLAGQLYLTFVSYTHPLFWSIPCRKHARRMTMNSTHPDAHLPTTLPIPESTLLTWPTLMTEEELIRFLRIPEISNAANHRHVIENLKRVHGLPRIHLCGKTVYLTDSIKQWLQRHVTCGN